MNLKMEDKKAYITIIEAEKLAENLFFTVGNDGISCKDSFLKGYEAALKLVEIKFTCDFAEWCSVNDWFVDSDKNWNSTLDIYIDKTLTREQLMQEFLKTYKG
jgi:hypothetical protein